MNEFKKNNRVQRTAIAIAIAGALSSSAAMAALEEEAASVQDVEVIEVRGIAGSMAESARQKRFDSRIVDAIVAEDIGKLPDQNIAEALSRITGVSLSSDFGVGDSITIRGISDNRVELNGRSTAGEGRGGIALSDFPSSFLKTVEVVKSPTPEMIEGALGGTVNMKTIRPLELKESLVAVSVDAEYSDKTKHTAPVVSTSAGANWELSDGMGTFGVSGMYSYLDRHLRRDEAFNRVQYRAGYDETDGSGIFIDEDFDGVADLANSPQGLFMVRDQNTVEQKTEDRQRTAYAATFQWAPESAAGNIYLEVNGTKKWGGQSAFSILDVGGSVATDAYTTQDGNGVLDGYSLDGAFTIPKTFSDFNNVESFSNALGGEWQLTDQLKIGGEWSTNQSKSHRNDAEFTLRPIDRKVFNETGAITNYTVTADINDQSGDKIPSVLYDGFPLLNPDYLALRTFQFEQTYIKNDEDVGRFDIEYSEPLGLEWIAAVKGGVRVTHREYTSTFSEFKGAKDLYKNADTLIWLDEMDEEFEGSATTIGYSNSFDQLGGSSKNDLLDYYVYSGHELQDASGTFLKIQKLLEGTDKETTGSLADNMTVKDSSWKFIEEDTRAAYIQFNLDFDEVTAVVGGRYVETDLDSSILVDGEKVKGENDYDDFLPSINLTWTVKEDLLVRFAAAKVMRRAGFSEVSPAFEINANYTDGDQGSVGLDPDRITQYDLSVEHYFGEGGLVSAAVFYKDVESFTKDTNYCYADPDTKAQQNVTEWDSICQLDNVGENNPNIIVSTRDEYNETDGFNHVAGLRDSNLTGVNIATTVNGGSGHVTGVELAYQQQFAFLPGAWSGLGFNGNYTYADSEQPDGNDLENISNHTLNAQIYWEWKGFQTRLAYNWRDSFLYSQNEKRVVTIGAKGYGLDNNSDPSEDGYDVTAGNNYQESRGQFDWSASYDINDNFTIVTNINNLTGEGTTYKTEVGNTWKYSESDRRYTVGLRATF